MLASILVPFSFKRISAEFLCVVSLLWMPLVWSGWDLPTVDSLSILMDKLSKVLVLLSLWTSILMTLLKPGGKFMSLNISLLLWSLLAFFSVSNLLSFFILFEASLVPTLLLIIGWGYQPERLEASYYFVFYTITLSIPLLISLVWLISVSGNKYFHLDDLRELCSGILGFLILSVFLIKLPMFMTHFWLPKAHVEAPVVGSMVLAGVLLKTGGYGIIRIFLYMSKTLMSTCALIFGYLGMIYVCFICLCCTDLKQVIAFSSVSHMNFMIVGLMNNSQVSFGGSTIMMVSHGLCSSLMFMLADICYSRSNSRSTLVNKGVLMVAPTLSMLWGLVVMFNMGVPPTASSISELLIIASSAKSILYSVMFVFYLFFSAFYSVNLYMVINHGNSGFATYSLSVKETFMSVSHLVPLMSLTLLVKLMLM